MTAALRRAERPAPPQPRADGMSLCLDCWTAYMYRDDRDLGVSRMKLRGRGDNEPHAFIERDTEAEQYLADIKTGEAVNAMIDSLPMNQRWAIYKSQGITTQWRFNSVDYATVLTEAQAALEQKLRKNIATRIHFL